jgi:nucleoside-diphosphate-sugar epimerase
MILVTGGTGLIGSHLLFRLVKNGKAVRANYRSTDALQKVSKVFGYYSDQPEKLLEKIQWVQADITNIGDLDQLFHGVEQVYHCAALISFDSKMYRTLVMTNVEGTANIVNLSLKHGVKKLCHVSSIAAIGSSKMDKEVTEDNEWSNTNASVYGITKHDAELEVWRASQEGLKIVIVNPGVVIGPGFWKSGSGSFFTYAAKGKTNYIPGGTGFVSINDVVKAMQTLMESNINGERFILVSENLSYGELFHKIAPKLGVSPPTKKISFWMLELMWRLDGLRSSVLGKRRRLTKAMVKGLRHQDIYSHQKLKEVLDFDFEDLDTAIDFCCSKFPD